MQSSHKLPGCSVYINLSNKVISDYFGPQFGRSQAVGPISKLLMTKSYSVGQALTDFKPVHGPRGSQKSQAARPGPRPALARHISGFSDSFMSVVRCATWMFDVRCSVQCPVAVLSSVHCPLSTVPLSCPVSRCPGVLSGVRCPLSIVLSGVRC